MSGQMSDVVVIDDHEFALVDPAPGTLFDVRAHGMAPVMMHTANTRGELARYRIEDDRLFLTDLQVAVFETPPPLNGIAATTDDYGQVWTYLGLDLAVDFTGDLIVGAEPIADLYTHSGFLPVWHYQRVTAFEVRDGILLSSEDRSQQVADYRAEREAADGPIDDEGVFERFLDSIKVRLGFDDEE